jgi:hypothetical protein
MEQAAGCRILAIIGSGETSPTMVTVHKSLIERLSPGRRRAVLLETPYGFQENAANVSARAQAYFARRPGWCCAASSAGPRTRDCTIPGPGFGPRWSPC